MARLWGAVRKGIPHRTLVLGSSTVASWADPPTIARRASFARSVHGRPRDVKWDSDHFPCGGPRPTPSAMPLRLKRRFHTELLPRGGCTDRGIRPLPISMPDSRAGQRRVRCIASYRFDPLGGGG